VTSIGKYAFANCCDLKKLYITNLSSWCKIELPTPSSHPLNCNGGNIYISGSEKTDIVIPNDILSINNYAFLRCKNIINVIIPNSVTSIGECAFHGCIGLESIKLPDYLKIINNELFDNCHKLKSITIPASVEYIYQKAFADCYELKEVTALPETPPSSNDNSFYSYNIPLRIPKSSIELYKSTNPWNKFTNILPITNDVIKGDANNDNEVTISDAVGIVNFILGNPSIYFNSSAADVNQDGKVTITDAVSVVNIILNNGEATAPALKNEEEIKEPE
jgi:hypothetical protein